MINFNDKTLRIVGAIEARDWMNPLLLGAVRRAAREGATLHEIRDRFWPDISYKAAWNRCAKLNIRYQRHLARLGAETTLTRSGKPVNNKSFHAGVIREASSL